MKKFIQQDSCLETSEGNEENNPQIIEAEQSTEIILRQDSVRSPEDSSSIYSPLRPVRTRRPPAWTKDYLALNSQEGMYFNFFTFWCVD